MTFVWTVELGVYGDNRAAPVLSLHCIHVLLDSLFSWGWADSLAHILTLRRPTETYKVSSTLCFQLRRMCFHTPGNGKISIGHYHSLCSWTSYLMLGFTGAQLPITEMHWVHMIQ